MKLFKITLLLLLSINFIACEKNDDIGTEVDTPFITTWKTDNDGLSKDNQITIPGTGTNYIINWEEVGNPTNKGTETATNTHTITFPNAGTYKISISGGAPEFSRINMFNSFNSEKLISIDQWGSIKWSSMESAFQDCKHLRDYNATDTPDLNNVTNMSFMFSHALIFNGDISNWNVNTITKMEEMFFSTSQFNQNLSGWDVSNVTVCTGFSTSSALTSNQLPSFKNCN